MKQDDAAKHLTPKQLTKAVYLTQLLFIFISIILAFILFIDIREIFTYIRFDLNEIFFYGILIGALLALFEIILYQLIAKKHFDDGGINEKIFKNQSIISIFFIALVVAIAEELLFRGVIQTLFGYIFASSLFAIVHVRYLKKPLLLLLIIGTSFLIGFLYELTSNLLVTIAFHFIVDFILGVFIKFNK